jgi:hypothetical protein
MKKNKRAALTSGSNLYLKNQLGNDFIPNGRGFQARCSFCWRELPDGGIRFDGIGACPIHFAIAKCLIEGLRRHRREYHAKFTKQINRAAEVATV